MQTASRYVRPALASDLPALARLHAAYVDWLGRAASDTAAPWVLADDAPAASPTSPAAASATVEASLAGLSAARAASARGAHLLAAVEDEAQVGFVLSVPVQSPEAEQVTPQGLELAASASAELAYLVVAPGAGEGHGERLLAALADVCRDESHTALRAWVPTVDQRLTELLTDSGFAPAGVEVQLDAGAGAPIKARLYATTL
ncbi:GNAT family N-acetyltransferase [Buchananella felis]|uniref:GNAT family N-acetyltransferase n=1 Tax=Buchananella felis TaxID=3231492 RepID=UPI0035295584